MTRARRTRILRAARGAAVGWTFLALGVSAWLACTGEDPNVSGGVDASADGATDGAPAAEDARADGSDARDADAGRAPYACTGDGGKPTGVLDTTFGTGGIALFDTGATSLGYGVAALEDGRIVIAATTVSRTIDSSRFDVIELAPNGTPEPTFGDGGLVTVAFPDATPPGSGAAAGVAVRRDGGPIVVAGYTGVIHEGVEGALVVLDRQGALRGPPARVGRDGGARALTVVKIQADGRLIAAGREVDESGDGGLLLMRFTGDGVLDTFTHRGPVSRFFDRSVYGTDVAQQGDRSIVLGTSEKRGLFLAAWTRDGGVDEGFADGGAVAIVQPWVRARALARDAAGRILVAGSVEDPAANRPVGSHVLFGITRFTPSGGVDGTFADGGTATLLVGAYYDDLTDIHVEEDGMLAIAGASVVAPSGGHRGVVGRLTADADPDRTFGQGGFVGFGPPALVFPDGGATGADAAASPLASFLPFQMTYDPCTSRYIVVGQAVMPDGASYVGVAAIR